MITKSDKSRNMVSKSQIWLVLLLLAVLIFVVYMVVKENKPTKKEAPIPVPSVAPFVEQTITEEEMIALEKEALSPAGVDASDWPTYTNKKYGFSFKYPEGVLIEGNIGFQNTNPEYASHVTLQARFNEKPGTSSRFFVSIDADKLTKEGDRCIPSPRLSLEQFVAKLRELNIENNERHKKWNDATVSEVILLTSGKEKGYMLTFDELVYDGCTSMGWGGVNNHPFRVYRLYEENNIRFKAETTYARDKSENPLYQVILDTLEFNEVLQEKSQ